MLEWTIAAETTRLDPREATRMRRPYLPASVRRYVSEDACPRAAGVACKIGGPFDFTDRFHEYVVERNAPKHPSGKAARVFLADGTEIDPKSLLPASA